MSRTRRAGYLKQEELESLTTERLRAYRKRLRSAGLKEDEVDLSLPRWRRRRPRRQPGGLKYVRLIDDILERRSA